MRYEFEALGPVIVAATMRSSDLDLTVSDRASQVLVDVIALKGGEGVASATRVEFAGNRLIIEVPKSVGPLFRSAGPVRVEVHVPPGASLEAESGSGDIGVRGPLMRLEARAGSGDLTFGSVGEATVTVGSGDVALEVVDSLRATAGSGDIWIGRVSGRAEFRAGSGDIVVNDGRDIIGVTGSGDIVLGRVEGSASVSTGSGTLTVRHAIEGQILAKAASGDVLVGVARGTAALLDCNSVSGRVTSDLVGGEAPGDEEKGVVLRLRTVSGDIRIRRA